MPGRNPNWAARTGPTRGPEFTRGTGSALISTFAGSMELMAHFEAGADQRGLDLIRTMWGFMLKAPKGTASTFWEGFNPDGSFAYDGSYTSLAHGWGTGPTSALTFYVLGAAPDSVAFNSLPLWHSPLWFLNHPSAQLHMAQRLAPTRFRGTPVAYR